MEQQQNCSGHDNVHAESGQEKSKSDTRVTFNQMDKVTTRRERSSASESQSMIDGLIIDDAVLRKRFSLRHRTVSLYGAPPSCRFGPKASLVQSQDTVLTIHDPTSQILSWCKPPQSVLIVKKIWDDLIDEPFVELAKWLAMDRNMDIYIEKKVMDDPLVNRQPSFASIRDRLSTFTEDKDVLSGKIDLIVCLGGDGTLLYASSLFQESVPPVIAFHFGSLGFLSPFDFSEYKDLLTRILRGCEGVRLMLRTRLRCCLKHDAPAAAADTNGPTSTKSDPIMVLNEVVVDRGATPYLCMLDLYIDHRLVTVVQGDGLIISTPTGSTAYAAAAGASMVHPNVPAVIIAPICPHSLSFRPIIVPAGVEIKVRVSKDARGDAWASFDGRQRQCLSQGSVLTICTSKYPLPSICHSDPVDDWFQSLAACLHWNDRKVQSSLGDTMPRQLTPDSVGSSESESNGSGR